MLVYELPRAAVLLTGQVDDRTIELTIKPRHLVMVARRLRLPPE